MTKTELDLCRKLAGLWSHHPKHGDTYPTQIDTTYFVCEDTDIFSLSDIEKSTSVLVPTIEDLLGILIKMGKDVEIRNWHGDEYHPDWTVFLRNETIMHITRYSDDALKIALLRAVIAVLSEQKEGG